MTFWCIPPGPIHKLPLNFLVQKSYLFFNGFQAWIQGVHATCAPSLYAKKSLKFIGKFVKLEKIFEIDHEFYFECEVPRSWIGLWFLGSKQNLIRFCGIVRREKEGCCLLH
jgi:hypothetical protein